MENLNLSHKVDNFLTEEELEVVNKTILSNEFPWFYQDESTGKEFPFFSHAIHPRSEGDEQNSPLIVNSPLHHFVTPIVRRYCETHIGEPLNKIYRSSLNCTYGWNTPYPYTEPHVDHEFDHFNLVVYLNDDFEGGETVLFDRYWCEDIDRTVYAIGDGYDDLKVLESISPKKGSISCFNGRMFHGMNNFKSGKRRVILIVTFS